MTMKNEIAGNREPNRHNVNGASPMSHKTSFATFYLMYMWVSMHFSTCVRARLSCDNLEGDQIVTMIV